MNKRAKLVQDIAQASTLSDQLLAVAALDQYDAGVRAEADQAKELDFTASIVEQTFTPVRTFEQHTAATDWLGQVEAPSADGMHQDMVAEASLWYGRVSTAVKADREEFAEQAKGMARRTASKYGPNAAQAAQTFIDYVAYLRSQAASGLDQIQQRIDPNNDPKATPLPTEVFDNFAPPIHPMNEGVSGTEDSQRAPLIQEVMGEGGGSNGPEVPDEHDTSVDYSHSYSEVPAGQPGVINTDPNRPTASLIDPTSVALGYEFNMDDWRKRQAAAAEGDSEAGQAGGFPAAGDDRFPLGYDEGEELGDTSGGVWGGTNELGADNPYHNASMKKGAPFAGYDDFAACVAANQDKDDPEAYCGKIKHQVEDSKKTGSRRQAASMLPQIQQTTDVHDGWAPTQLPQDVMFPINPNWDQSSQANGEQTQQGAPSVDQRQAVLAHLMRRNPATWTPQQSAFIRDVLKRNASLHVADQWSAPPNNAGMETPVGNSSATTPHPATDGAYQQGLADGQADRAAGDAPTFSDASSHASPYVQGYSAGFGNGQGAQVTSPDVPYSMGGDAGQQQNAADSNRLNAAASRRTARDFTEKGRENAKYSLGPDHKLPINNEQDLKNAHTRAHQVTGVSEDAVNSYLARVDKAMGYPLDCEHKPKGKESVLRASAAFVKDAELASTDFVKGYNFARAWTPKRRLVATGSAEFEAGLYAGITDNPGQQHAWVTAHRKQATKHPELTTRLKRHKYFTRRFATLNEDALVKGHYVQAATSTDLNTDGPGVSPDPTGQTPINGPGQEPELAGQTNPAAPGGPAPYNAAPPYGSPVTEDPMLGGGEKMRPQTAAFRALVQAGKRQ